MSKAFATAAVVATLAAVPAAAEGAAIAGTLSRHEARSFVRTELPAQAPKLLLGDKRANFFHTRSINILGSRRINRSEITVRYRLRMVPDKAHREAHWFPIRCQGKVWVGKRSDRSLIGQIKDYKCVTILP